jgi:hypothetical protein
MQARRRSTVVELPDPFNQVCAHGCVCSYRSGAGLGVGARMYPAPTGVEQGWVQACASANSQQRACESTGPPEAMAMLQAAGRGIQWAETAMAMLVRSYCASPRATMYCGCTCRLMPLRLRWPVPRWRLPMPLRGWRQQRSGWHPLR